MLLESAKVSPDELAPKIENYLAKVLGSTVALAAPQSVSLLPFYLRDRYAFLVGQIAGRQCLFMIASSSERESTSNIEKHVSQAQVLFPEAIVVVVFEYIDSRSRANLISHHLDFVVPGNQMFIPSLAIDLRERYRSERQHFHSSLSPTAQQVTIATILGHQVNKRRPSQLANQFKTSAMSMGRAFDELSGAGLADVISHGKEKQIVFRARGHSLWNQSRRLLKNPVRKRRRIGHIPESFPSLLAGESALARYTSLVEPKMTTVAVAAAKWNALVDIFKIAEHEPNLLNSEECIIETWAYDPSTLSDTKLVDPISLYLSFQEMNDERIQMASESLLESFVLERP